MRRRAAMPAIAAGLVLLGSLMTALPASAQQRNPLQRVGQTVADQPSQHYRFERFTVSSADGSRTWRVDVAMPRAAAQPERGFASFWMLDGNGALIEFDERLLGELAARPDPQVLVFVGYDNDLRIDSPARTRDYPFVSDTREGAQGAAEQVGGGADAFLEAIERQIQPELARRVALDPDRRTLWGHSLGGLFVLHALYTRTGLFQTFAAGSPSLWWGNGAMLRGPERRFATHNAGRPVQVLLSLGGGERARDTSNRDMSNPRVLEHLRRVSAAPPDAVEGLAGRLRAVPGVDVHYREFDGLTHGPMFRASLMDALHRVTGVADRSGTPRPGGASGGTE